MAETPDPRILLDMKRLKALYEKYGEEITAEMRNRLVSSAVRGGGRFTGKPGYATGELYDSISYQVYEDGAEVVLSFFMAEHGVFVDKGRKPGKFPPLSAIKDWCRLKKIPVEAAYPIARKIGTFGIPATNFYTIPITRRQNQMMKDVANFMSAEVQAKIDKYLSS